MATYCVTFRIAAKKAAGKTYDERYDQLMANAQAHKEGFWAETTSFMLVGSSAHTEPFTKSLAEGLSATDDLLVVFDPGDHSACYFGDLANDPVLRSFFPLLKKVQ